MLQMEKSPNKKQKKITIIYIYVKNNKKDSSNTDANQFELYDHDKETIDFFKNNIMVMINMMFKEDYNRNHEDNVIISYEYFIDTKKWKIKKIKMIIIILKNKNI